MLNIVPVSVMRLCLFPVLLIAAMQQQAAGYSATVTVDVTVAPAMILGLLTEDALVTLDDALTAYLAPPSDVVITSENQHATVPGNLRLTASSASPSSTATLQQNLTDLTPERATPLVLSIVPAPFASLASAVSITAISSPLTVTFDDALSSPPAPPTTPPPSLPPLDSNNCTLVETSPCLRAGGSALGTLRTASLSCLARFADTLADFGTRDSDWQEYAPTCVAFDGDGDGGGTPLG